jgi:hypothetical protein
MMKMFEGGLIIHQGFPFILLPSFLLAPLFRQSPGAYPTLLRINRTRFAQNLIQPQLKLHAGRYSTSSVEVEILSIQSKADLFLLSYTLNGG